MPSAGAFAALLIAGLVLTPILAVVWLAFTGQAADWQHLWSSTLPRYLTNSALMMAGVGAVAALIGTTTAWAIVHLRFPLHGLLSVVLLAPMAIPAYVAAFALVDVLEYAGPVQSMLRDLFGWQTARDYWFPEIRSRWAGVLVLGLALYPYVYLFARDAFEEQGARPTDVARSLGHGPWAVFWRTSLPLARPGIVAASAIVMMEVLNDFGTMDYFAIQTLTTGIFTQWLEARNAGGAAQIATMMMVAVLFLAVTERMSRDRSRFDSGAKGGRAPVRPVNLRGVRSYLVMALVALPFLLGFAMPVAVLVGLARPGAWLAEGLWRDGLHTLALGGIASVLTIAGALLLYQAVRFSGSVRLRWLLPATTIGYATPGAVLALGILAPLVPIEHRVADFVQSVTGTDPGLLFTGTGAALVLAYFVRFFAMGQGAVESGLSRVTPSMDMAARTLGQTRGGVTRRVHIPLIRASLATAFVMIFVDTVKELPATLMLRPFDFDTLATRVYSHASREDLEAAAPAALLVTLAGLVPVLILAFGRRRASARR